MGKAALTFAEIFIVLGLIFLIQMVANFNIYEGTSEVPPPDFTTLKIRQIPSDGNDADHIKYLYFSSNDPENEINLQIKPGLIQLRDTGSYIDDQGNCRIRDSSRFQTNMLNWENANDQELFKKNLYENFGISLSMVKVSNAQNEYILAWSPADLPEGATLTVAVEHCFLRNTESARKLDPVWKVSGDSVPYPHPLIFERTEYRESIDVQPSRRVMVHYTQFYDENDSHNNGLPKTTGPKFAGYAFNTSVKDCHANSIVNNVRSLMVKEVNITL